MEDRVVRGLGGHLKDLDLGAALAYASLTGRLARKVKMQNIPLTDTPKRIGGSSGDMPVFIDDALDYVVLRTLAEPPYELRAELSAPTNRAARRANKKRGPP